MGGNEWPGLVEPNTFVAAGAVVDGCGAAVVLVAGLKGFVVVPGAPVVVAGAANVVAGAAAVVPGAAVVLPGAANVVTAAPPAVVATTHGGSAAEPVVAGTGGTAAGTFWAPDCDAMKANKMAAIDFILRLCI